MSRNSLHDAIHIGKIVERDLDNASVRVAVGDIETHWIGWNAHRAGNLRIWSPPSVGEQVILCLPDGDWEAGFLLGALFSDERPAPATDGSTLLIFDDGARFSYDMETAQLDVDLSQANGAIAVKAPGNITIDADIQLNGTLVSNKDVIASGISLKGHKHSDVQSGSAQSGGPV